MRILLFTCLISIPALRLSNLEDEDVKANLRNRFWSREGLVLQMFECTRQRPMNKSNIPGCLQKQLNSPVASFLRYDLPAVAFPHSRQFGLLYKNSIKATKASLVDVHCTECESKKQCNNKITPEEYARSVISDTLIDDTLTGGYLDHHIKEVITKGGNCIFSSFEEMGDYQHAVLDRMYGPFFEKTDKFQDPKRDAANRESYERLQCFYNQVEFESAKATDIAAVFYTNHTMGSQWFDMVTSKKVSPNMRDQLDADVHVARQSAFDIAEVLGKEWGVEVPVLQFKHGDQECSSPEQAVRRALDYQTKNSNALIEDNENLFQDPM